ncbi:hypothetical protein J6590_097743 [Homalodisca vitripennis]|nr:hypothetical protein J6590_097743 [Homalodisca vitripennis]
MSYFLGPHRWQPDNPLATSADIRARTHHLTHNLHQVQRGRSLYIGLRCRGNTNQNGPHRNLKLDIRACHPPALIGEAGSELASPFFPWGHESVTKIFPRGRRQEASPTPNLTHEFLVTPEAAQSNNRDNNLLLYTSPALPGWSAVTRPSGPTHINKGLHN